MYKTQNAGRLFALSMLITKIKTIYDYSANMAVIKTSKQNM